MSTCHVISDVCGDLMSHHRDITWLFNYSSFKAFRFSPKFPVYWGTLNFFHFLFKSLLLKKQAFLNFIGAI